MDELTHAGSATVAKRSCGDADVIEEMNRDCFCITLDPNALRHELEADFGARGLTRPLLETHPHLFASLPVFVSRRHVERMAEIIAAVESVVGMDMYRSTVQQWAPEIAAFDPGPRGVFLGYDFHLDAAGPRLIEINTNAGGALLNTVLGRAQRQCCEAMTDLTPGTAGFNAIESAMLEMFTAEWRLQRGSAELKCIAIVDDDPGQQYLLPEFLLFQQLFRRGGIEAIITDPEEFALRQEGLWHASQRIDLVYNRLTDFSLQLPQHSALRSAYLNGQVVLTPHPRAHALYADKRNLAALTDTAQLFTWRVPESTVATLLAGIARTTIVAPEAADQLWGNRRKLFFKPASGFGSKAVYRGDKLTRRVWEEILAGDYVAQAFVPPSERIIRDAASPLALKLDLRSYIYEGKVQMLAARLYQGHTTNFRTPEGGFATVFYPQPVDAATA
jgi:hypothetical protein